MKKTKIKLGDVPFIGEICETDQEKMEGLQKYQSIKPHYAMIFPYNGIVEATFHMGTVNYPIDMIFCENGRISNIKKNVQPADKNLFSNKCDMVVEIKGGMSDLYGLDYNDPAKLFM